MWGIYLAFIYASAILSCLGRAKAKRNDYFAAIVHMEPLVRREQALTENFLDVIRTEEAKLDKLEKEIDEIERVLPKPGYTSAEMAKFIGNSVNALKLIQRFVHLWPTITTTYNGENSTLREYFLHKEYDARFFHEVIRLIMLASALCEIFE